MANRWRLLRSVFSREIPLIVAVALTLVSAACATGGRMPRLEGQVTSAGVGLAGYKVSLYASYGGSRPRYERIGSDMTDQSGHFRIPYSRRDDKLERGLNPVLFVIAQKGPVMLASAIGVGSNVPENVVINERTTVATGNAFAQFIHDREIEGNIHGMINAVHMAANLANPQTGAVGIVLASTPNGTETSTFPTFNSLVNVVASCVSNDRNCGRLFEATTPPGGPRPDNVLEAIANLVKNPSYPGYPTAADDPVFLLSKVNPLYQPALTQRPTNWLLFLKITGGFYSAQDSDNLMNGPGNFAIDERGFVWVNDNAVPQPPGEFACAGRRLMNSIPGVRRFPGHHISAVVSAARATVSRSIPAAMCGSGISDFRIRPARCSPGRRRTIASPPSSRTAPQSPVSGDIPRARSRGRRERCRTARGTSGSQTAEPTRSRRYLEEIPIAPSTFPWDPHQSPAIHR